MPPNAITNLLVISAWSHHLQMVAAQNDGRLPEGDNVEFPYVLTEYIKAICAVEDLLEDN